MSTFLNIKYASAGRTILSLGSRGYGIMGRRSRLVRSILILLLASALAMANSLPGHAAAKITIGDASEIQGGTGFTVDVTVSGHVVDIRGAEINIGYDTNSLTFDGGVKVDGDWTLDRIDTVTVDDTNIQSGQIKILLAASGTGVGADTTATLARLTFDYARTLHKVPYPPTYLGSSPGLRDSSIEIIAATAVNDYVTNLMGDIDDNGTRNVLDILAVIGIIFGKEPTAEEYVAANVDTSNQSINILDLLGVIDFIFGN